VDEIIMLENGRILEMGSYQELVSNQSDFSKFIENYVTSSSQEEDDAAPQDASNKKSEAIK
jgi:ABC-type proline/glycine betaine transport system ATPase subunit